MCEKMTEVKKITDYIWEIPKSGDMVVPGRIYADEEIIKNMLEEEKQKPEWNSLTQVKNVACLPGIQKYSFALADVHTGYGSPIGGVAAMDMKEGVAVFGLCGFDINCGLQTLKTELTMKDIEPVKEKLAQELFETVPAGLGEEGNIRLNESEMNELLVKGAEFVIERGYGIKEDLEFLEEYGKMAGAEPEAVSKKAKQRQKKEIGTLGSGNHYLEVQVVEKIFDEEIGKAFGLFEGQILASIHCGSRGLGHQIGMDYLQELSRATEKYGIKVKDKELVCAPIQSEEGKKYLSAVNAGMNCAFANREAITHLARQAFSKTVGVAEEDVKLLYGVSHNTIKKEKHRVDGKTTEFLIHRKGSTRGFAAGREEVCRPYRKVGHPIIVGGSMGTASYILAGTQKGMDDIFGSAVHGAGRLMSRNQAIREFKGESIVKELAGRGIIIKGHSWKGIAEEADDAYKDIHRVVDVMHNSGVNKKVAMLRPVITIKG